MPSFTWGSCSYRFEILPTILHMVKNLILALIIHANVIFNSISLFTVFCNVKCFAGSLIWFIFHTEALRVLASTSGITHLECKEEKWGCCQEEQPSSYSSGKLLKRKQPCGDVALNSLWCSQKWQMPPGLQIRKPISTSRKSTIYAFL